VACGTGGHIPYLREAFTIEGLDLDPQMLRIARAKHPDVSFHAGDMADFELGRQFDVVVSLFSSVGYVRTPDRLAKAVAAMARHVRPGGVLIVEPFFSPQTWKERTEAPAPMVSEKPELSIARMVDWRREGNLVTMTFHYLVGTAGGVEHFTEEHRMGLLSDEEHRAAFAAAGMTVAYDEQGLMGRGLYIGTRRHEPWSQVGSSDARTDASAAGRCSTYWTFRDRSAQPANQNHMSATQRPSRGRSVKVLRPSNRSMTMAVTASGSASRRLTAMRRRPSALALLARQ
jgi:SAM-dependent methyltransferase